MIVKDEMNMQHSTTKKDNDKSSSTLMSKLLTLFKYIILFQHANSVRKKHAEILEMIMLGEYKRKPPSFQVPEADLPIRENVVPGTW